MSSRTQSLVESLESRQLLSAGVQSYMSPLQGATWLDVSLGGDNNDGEDGRGFSGGDDHGFNSRITRVPPVNGGFETFPDFTGWQATGNDSVLASDFYTPPEGAAQAVLSSGPNTSGGSTNPVSAAKLETFLGLKTGALSNKGGSAFNGSAIKQTITAKPFDILTFKADFLTNELDKKAGGNPDYAFVSITFNGKTQLVRLSDALKTTSTPVQSSTGFVRETGYHTYALVLPRGGQYTIGFGVVNANDAMVASDLLVDNVRLQPLFNFF